MDEIVRAGLLLVEEGRGNLREAPAPARWLRRGGEAAGTGIPRRLGQDHDRRGPEDPFLEPANGTPHLARDGTPLVAPERRAAGPCGDAPLNRPAISRLLARALPRRQVRDTVDSYRRLHDESHGGDVDARRRHSATMTTRYFDLVTDFYEYG